MSRVLALILNLIYGLSFLLLGNGEGHSEAHLSKIVKAVFGEYPNAFHGDPSVFIDMVSTLAAGNSSPGYSGDYYYH